MDEHKYQFKIKEFMPSALTVCYGSDVMAKL